MANLGRYRSDAEKKYHEDRDAFIAGIDKKDIADAPFLFSTRAMVSEMAVRFELFSMVRDVSGAIVECGVAKGNNLLLFGHLSSIMEPYAINRRIIGFDTFEGFRSLGGKGDPRDIGESDFSETSEKVVQRAIDLADLNRAAGHIRRTEIVKGDAVTTIGPYVENHPELTVALLYLDFDIYEPTRVALQHLLPLVCKGGIVAFDEFNYDKFAGETAAAKEMLDLRRIELRRFYYDPFVAYFRVS
ncbi:MAG TPA: TylF/MycF/NovP-related O-methyltransferase [Stellaceae bacterium]|nr:TylF/MycF/NovP-related O-methyltransferase [Stellaceae bacterium]